MWVKGHSRVVGDEMADFKAKEGVALGIMKGAKSIATPAGIRQMYRISRKTRQVAEWDRNALEGLSYICTDRGHRPTRLA